MTVPSVCWPSPRPRPPPTPPAKPRTLAAANAAPQGDDLVKVGEDMIGEGKAKDAIGVIQSGMKKPLKDANNAKMRLGQAYIAAGQKGDAAKAVSDIKAPPNDAAVAHLWTLVCAPLKAGTIQIAERALISVSALFLLPLRHQIAAGVGIRAEQRRRPGRIPVRPG